ncbi:MAG: two-component system sensor histidine kinase NtrB [Planctomycetota bacterium]|jgi:signal transduction histidine kinase
MATKVSVADELMDKPSQCTREVLVEQVLWLIRLRWIAVGGIVTAVLVGTYAFAYPLLTSAMPIYVCAGCLLLCNVFYLWMATKKATDAGPKDVVLAMIQVEADLVILTAVLHFSGGWLNPFFLFYIFHIIIATIILPRNLSFTVGLSAILLFCLLGVSELNGAAPPEYAAGGLWRDPVYILSAFVAFVCTVVLAQYLTRMIIVRMTTKELEAARNNDVLKAVISAMAEGLIFVTHDGNVAICNPAAKLWKKDSDINKYDNSFDDFLPTLAEHMKGLLASGDKAASGAKEIKFNTERLEQRYIEAKSCPVGGIDGQRLGYVIVGQDLTEHKKLEKDLLERTEDVTEINEMLKMSRIKMAQREKMVAIGQMATGIAHEIGNPLASLSSVAQYLGRRLSTHEEKENLLVIQYQVNRISNILKRMLSLSRPATSEYKWTDINELIDNTLSLVGFDRRAKSITIKNIANPDLPMVWLNPQNFEQVLLNIFINALDAMNAKQGEQKDILEITRESKDGMIEIRVSDTGIGMSPQVARRAFESFFTTKEIGKGTGLGLFISYNLVAEIDGTIAMESELDKGTTVIIQIPKRPKKHLIGTDDVKKDFLNSVKAVKEGDG